jgi:hydrogenase/urease accessory protein HupE
LRRLGDGRALVPDWGELETLPERQSLRLPFVLDRPVRGALDIEALLFPYDANHQTFINIYERGELKQQAILDSRRESLTFYSGSLQGRWAVVTTFVRAGVHHILIGPDHVLFLFGLMLLGGSWWRLAAIVTAFTVGHSITLSLAALEIVNLSPSIVEPAIALSIIVVGVDNLLGSRERRSTSLGAPTNLVTSRDLRSWMAGVFGLIHGFGFAAVLIELGLPSEALGWSLAAFNVGVEVGQLFIVLALLAIGRLAVRLPVYRVAHAERFLTLASVAVIAAGVYWLVQRVGLMPAA